MFFHHLHPKQELLGLPFLWPTSVAKSDVNFRLVNSTRRKSGHQYGKTHAFQWNPKPNPLSAIGSKVIEVVERHMLIFHYPFQRRSIGPLPSCFSKYFRDTMTQYGTIWLQWQFFTVTDWMEESLSAFDNMSPQFQTTLANIVQRFTKRLVRGCENFLPALA